MRNSTLKRRHVSKSTVVLVLLAFASIAFAQKVPPPPPERTDSAALRQRIERNEARVSEVEKQLISITTKLEESGWKALDATTKLSALTWQTLSFFIALMAAFTYGGWQGYKLLRDKLEMDLKESMSNYEAILRHSTGAMAFGELCMGFWEQYSSIPASEPGAEGTKKRLLDATLKMSVFALEHVERLEPLDYEKYEDLITNVKINFAYWLAVEPDPADPSKPNPKNAEKAQKLANTAFVVATKYWKSEGVKYLNRWPEWIESYCFVLTRFGDTEQQVVAKEIIRQVCTDLRIDAAWRKQTRAEHLGEST
jgi:hypothetical protein